LIDANGYCEEVDLIESSKYFLGANISGSVLSDFVFSLNSGGSEVATCSISVGSASYNSSVGCFVSFDSKQDTGKYDICIKKQSGGVSQYKIRRESSGVNCGYYVSSSYKESDYSLFVKTPFYAASSGNINLGDGFEDVALNSIDSYLDLVYKKDCSSGCIIPISFYGNNVTINISGLDYKYGSSAGVVEASKLYSVVEDSYRVNLSRVVSFKSFNWTVNFYGNKSFYINMYFF
jgi:hypothetical protein